MAKSNILSKLSERYKPKLYNSRIFHSFFCLKIYLICKIRWNWQWKLGTVLEGSKVQIFAVLLLVVDVTIVMVQLGLEGIFPKCAEDVHVVNVLEHLLGWISLTILLLFALELVLLLLAFYVYFFFHPLYVLDFLIISISLGLEFGVDEESIQGVAVALILMRLW